MSPMRAGSAPRRSKLMARENIAQRIAPAARPTPFTTSSRRGHEFATPCGRARGRLASVASHCAKDETLRIGELEVRLADGLMLAAGTPLTLSVREFELLVAMARRVGRIVTRAELYGSVWGGELRRGDRSVDVYVSKLRAKLERAMPDRHLIHTHPGFGYRFQAQPARGPRASSPGEDPAGADPSVNGLSHDLHTSATGT